MRRTSAVLLFAGLMLSFAPRPAVSIVVCLDPGHGGGDPGNSGDPVICFPGDPPQPCNESALTLWVAGRTSYLLDISSGGPFDIRQTHYDDDDAPWTPGNVSHGLLERLRRAYDFGALIFVSIHENSGGARRTFVEYDDTENQAAYYLWPYSKELADDIATGLCTRYTSTHPGVECLGSCLSIQANCSGHTNFVTRRAKIPAVIGEPIGLQTPEGDQLCLESRCETPTTDESLKQAQGYADGIKRYFAIGTPLGNILLSPWTDGHSVSVAWHEADSQRNVTYEIDRADACWGPWAPLVTVASHDPQYTQNNEDYLYVDGGVAYARAYWYRLRVTTEVVAASATPNLQTQPNLPGTPSGLAAQGSELPNGDALINLSWTASSGQVSGYYVFRSLTGDMQVCTEPHEFLGSTNTTSFQDAAAPAGVPLSYRIVAYNAAAASDVSNLVTLTVTRTVGVADLPGPTITSLDHVAPNPSRGPSTINFSLASEALVSLKVIDVSGRVVAELLDQRMPAGRHTVQWAEGRSEPKIPAGVYFVLFRADNKMIGRRALVVLR